MSESTINLLRRPFSQQYVEDTRRPLHALVFLLPILIVHEVGTYWFAATAGHGVAPRVGAYVLLQWFIQLFGQTTSLLPAATFVIVLLAWHIASGDSWRIHPRTLAGMLGESIVWALPLLVFHAVMLAAPASQAAQNPFVADLLLSLGAGIYEELVFRLILFGLLALLLIDCFGLPVNGSLVAITLITAGAFAAYHHLAPSVEVFTVRNFLFRTAAGVYLAGLFLWRGFGIAAGCHAAYNVIAICLDYSNWGDAS